MQVPNHTMRMPKRLMLCRAYLVRWFEFLRPDICQHYLGFTWQIFYQGQAKLLVLSNKEKEFPSWIFDILSDLLGEPILLGVGHNLLAMGSSEKGSISRFHQYLVALEKKHGLIRSFSVFVGYLDTFDLVSAWIEVSKER
ncbi:MAG: hypothetical protein GPJ00_01105 [Microcystis aeruginosa W13-18]|nr:hypothetical protein [Microcystis aeruginosa W13-18]NCR48440.1 hypothetical protein [Microcystis aeruginosa S11-01]